MKLTHASVFSGIGGPEVAAAMLGWENLFHCEINPFGRKVLQYWFPNSKSYEDIKKQTLPNGEAESTFFPADSLANLSVLPASEKAMKMTATSGKKCTAALKKSSLLGSFVRTLLESSRWSNKARYLKWQVKQFCSERLTLFCDSDIEQPLPSNASAQILRQTDMKSSRCLFQLVPLAHPTNVTESSLSGDELTPFLKTPCTADSYTDQMKSKGVSGTSGTLAQEVVNGFAEKHRGLLLPTPITCDFMEGTIDGETFRLSPLFVEEMMGFPLMWTALPFLSESGAPNPSKPTATPSSPK